MHTGKSILHLELQGQTNVRKLNPIRIGEGFCNVLYFLVSMHDVTSEFRYFGNYNCIKNLICILNGKKGSKYATMVNKNKNYALYETLVIVKGPFVFA